MAWNPKDLDLVLCQFCVSFQKKNGQQDEIGSVRLIPASLNRYLVEKNFVNSTICYVNLKHRITVREVKPQFLRQAGMGKNDMIWMNKAKFNQVFN